MARDHLLGLGAYEPEVMALGLSVRRIKELNKAADALLLRDPALTDFECGNHFPSGVIAYTAQALAPADVSISLPVPVAQDPTPPQGTWPAVDAIMTEVYNRIVKQRREEDNARNCDNRRRAWEFEREQDRRLMELMRGRPPGLPAAGPILGKQIAGISIDELQQAGASGRVPAMPEPEPPPAYQFREVLGRKFIISAEDARRIGVYDPAKVPADEPEDSQAFMRFALKRIRYAKAEPGAMNSAMPACPGDDTGPCEV